MGGVAGHLSHVHEDLDFTFGEIKSLLSDVASANIEAVEKLDGQNIFFKFFVDPESGELRTARNAGDVKKGGMTANKFVGTFKGHPAEAPFLNGFEAINRALSRVSPESLKKIFTGEDGNQRFVNAEIIYANHPNIINYSSDNIVMHNLQEFDDSGKAVDIQLKGGDFGQLVDKVTSAAAKDDSDSWGFYGPQIVNLRDITETGAHAKLVEKLDARGMSDSDTLADYVEKRLRDTVLKPLNLPADKVEDLVTRIVGIGQKKPLSELPAIGPIKKGLTKDMQKEVSKIGSKVKALKLVSILLRPIEDAISDFAIEVLRGMESFLVDDTDAEVKRMKDELNSSIAALQAVEGEDAEKIGDMLDKQLSKLGDIEDHVNSSMEGVIFENPPGSKKLYKLTGSFAMVNQIIGRARRLPSKDAQNENLIKSYVQAILMG